MKSVKKGIVSATLAIVAVTTSVFPALANVWQDKPTPEVTTLKATKKTDKVYLSYASDVFKKDGLGELSHYSHSSHQSHRSHHSHYSSY